MSRLPVCFLNEVGWSFFLVVAVCTSSACGCKRATGPKRVALQGKVQRGGTPLPQGVIRFKLIGNGSGPAAATGIQDGRYQFDDRNGPLPGRYEVIIQAVVDSKRSLMQGPRPANLGSSEARHVATPWTFEIDIPAQSTFDLPFELP